MRCEFTLAQSCVVKVFIEGKTSRRDKCEEITSGLCVEICDCARCRLQTNSMSVSLWKIHDLL